VAEIIALLKVDKRSERQFDLAWYPGVTGDEVNRYNRLAKPTLYDAAVALLAPGRSTFLADSRLWGTTPQPQC